MLMVAGVLGEINSKIMGVIPARYNSTRLPGKPLLEIHGKPMIYWVAKRVASSILPSYCVATDDIRIRDVCAAHSIPCVMTSGACSNGTERVAEVAEKFDVDYFINIQGDEPCINVAAINKMVLSADEFTEPCFIQAISRLTSPEIIADVSVVKVAVSARNEAIYFSRAPIPYPRDNENSAYYRCLGLYLYNREFLKIYASMTPTRLEQIEQIEQLRVLENGLRIKTVEVEDDGLSVDTPEDLDFVRKARREFFQ